MAALGAGLQVHMHAEGLCLCIFSSLGGSIGKQRLGAAAEHHSLQAQGVRWAAGGIPLRGQRKVAPG